MASLARDAGDAVLALRLAGAVAAVAAGTATEQRGSAESQPWSPNWLSIQERARAALTAAEAASAWAVGQAMTLEQAIAYTLEQPADG